MEEFMEYLIVGLCVFMVVVICRYVLHPCREDKEDIDND